MIQPLRKSHRRIFFLLAILLPSILFFAISRRLPQ